MDNNKFNNIDINTIMKIAQTGNTPKKVGGHSTRVEEHQDLVIEWMKNISLSEGALKVLSSDLHEAFSQWLVENKHPEMHIKKFGRILSKLLRKTRTNKGQMYLCNKNPKESVTNEKEVKE